MSDYSASELDDSGVRGEQRCGEDCNPNPFTWLVVAAVSIAFFAALARDVATRGWHRALFDPGAAMALLYYLAAIALLCLIGRFIGPWIAAATAAAIILSLLLRHRSAR